jgi:TolA-binding protein
VNAHRTIVALALFTGCSAATPPLRDASDAERAELLAAKARAAELEAELSARHGEVRRLESELALLRARPATARVSIRTEPAAWDEPTMEYDDTRRDTERAMPETSARVSLKLYGDRDAGEALAFQTSAPRVETQGRADARAEQAPGSERALIHYRNALTAIRGRNLEAAIPLLDLAIEHAPSVGHRIDAVYWRGEVLYLLGRHVEAEVEFASIVSAEIEHARRPASLLRLGQCRRLRGLEADAASLFDRLRAEYPSSHAAAQLRREGVL